MASYTRQPDSIADHPSYRLANADVVGLDNRGGGPHHPEMETRIASLEGSVKGLMHSQPILIAAVIGFAGLVLAGLALVVTLQFSTNGRVDQLQTKMDALPGQIGDSVRESNRAFSDALSAAVQATRQPAPQVIVLPQQQPPKTP